MKYDKDALAFWQDRIAKFFPTAKGPTTTEAIMYDAGVAHGRKMERERCAQVVFDSKPGDTNGDVMKRILNPPSEESEV